MATKSKPAWYGLAAVAIGTSVFFLATNKGRLFKKGKAGIKALLSGTSAAPETAPALSTASFRGRTPTPENGHVRDVIATSPPAPDSGTNFTKHGDVHGQQEQFTE